MKAMLGLLCLCFAIGGVPANAAGGKATKRLHPYTAQSVAVQLRSMAEALNAVAARLEKIAQGL